LREEQNAAQSNGQNSWLKLRKMGTERGHNRRP
jgi:hypothetical protein